MDEVQRAFADDSKRGIILALLALAVLVHVSWFPGHIARKRRHPRASMITWTSLLMIPLSVGLWFSGTEVITMAILVGAWFVYWLAWAYRSSPVIAPASTQDDGLAERLAQMRPTRPPPPMPEDD
jgi:hypothetical protein